MNFEPNLALDLEIADLINSKKGNAYVGGWYMPDEELTEAQPPRSCSGYCQLRQQSESKCVTASSHCTLEKNISQDSCSLLSSS